MKIFITGGAGFIGCNCAKYFIENGHETIIFDNLSRTGTELNLEWLKTIGSFHFIKGDLRDQHILEKLFIENTDVDVVLHLAAQTAVTTSVVDPREDFDINALGTLNLLEAVRLSECNPIVIYASTNKVYGNLEHHTISKNTTRYELVDFPKGLSEETPLDFHSPYGCSKGVADQYIRDYHRIYGLRTVVFRQSCIYGPRQMGVEDQGWVAWFILAALEGKPLTIFGDGLQVRDLLYIDDLSSAYVKAIEHIDRANGEIYNVGGGPENQISLLEFLKVLKNQIGLTTQYSFSSWREGDQRVFISDNAKLRDHLGWQPTTTVGKGLDALFHSIQLHLKN